jgi:subtilase family serine protease
MRLFRAILFPVLLVSSLLSTFSFAVQPDRISGALDSSQMLPLKGNVHGLAQPQLDRGRTDGGKLMSGVSLVFKPSKAQQAALDNLLKQQQNPSSPSYHKWLTPTQFGALFGMSQNDLDKVTAWLASQGLTVTHVSNSRNQIFIEGTVAAVELAFRTEIHNYFVDGELHFANATEPSVPAMLATSTLGINNLHNFQPKPRIKSRSMSMEQADPHFTSYVSGNHFLTPGDYATIYSLQSLYSSGIDGTGESIAIVGQSAINLTDISNFRSAAGLPAKAPTITFMSGTGVSTVCSGDEFESDLDVEWSGGVAKNATITFIYPGLLSGESCVNRTYGAFDALQYAVDHNVGRVISSSYGNCESALGLLNVQTIQGWAQQANTQGQTIVSSSGDSGAADCDFQVTSATQGFAVDIPAAIPEVTGAGGTEFSSDSPTNTTNNPPGANPPYWAAAGSNTDTLSSALEYIPEKSWNDTTADLANGGTISASGGGKSIYFPKPTWQTGTGVPADGQRDVPDISASASADHDPYLICSEDGANPPTCTAGFRDSNGNLAAVGGTSAAAPTLAAVFALVDQYLVTNGFQSTSGLGNANPSLYHFAAYSPSALNDITSGSNIVPCTTGTTSCPTTGTLQYGFSAGTGYDQVTGLGSINGNALATAWGNLLTTSTTSVTPSAAQVFQGDTETLTIAVTPSTATGVVTLYNNGSTTALGTATVTAGAATFSTSSLAIGTNSIVATYNGNFATSNAPATVVTVVTPFALSSNPTSANVIAGHTVNSTLTLAPHGGFNAAVTYSCSAGVTCTFSPANPTTATSVVASIQTPANLAAGALPVTITGTSGTFSAPSNVALTVAVTDQSFTLAPTAATLSVAQGSPTSTTITMTPVNGFNTALTYTCTGQPSESTCTISPSTATTSATVTLNVTTTAPTAMLRTPFGRGSRIFYAALLPGLFGIVFAAGSRKRSAYGMRVLGLIVVLGCSTLWLGACSNSSSGTKNPGTPTGTYTLTVSATTGGAFPISNTTTVQLTVTP